MSINALTWIEHISRQTGIPAEEVERRVRVQYWKDEIEVFDLGVFVPFLEAEGVRELRLSGLGIVYDRPQEGVEPNASPRSNVKIYTYGQGNYFFMVLLGEYMDEFSIMDGSGNPLQLSEKQRKMYEENRERMLVASKLKQRDTNL